MLQSFINILLVILGWSWWLSSLTKELYLSTVGCSNTYVFFLDIKISGYLLLFELWYCVSRTGWTWWWWNDRGLSEWSLQGAGCSCRPRYNESLSRMALTDVKARISHLSLKLCVLKFSNVLNCSQTRCTDFSSRLLQRCKAFPLAALQ